MLKLLFFMTIRWNKVDNNLNLLFKINVNETTVSSIILYEILLFLFKQSEKKKIYTFSSEAGIMGINIIFCLKF